MCSSVIRGKTPMQDYTFVPRRPSKASDHYVVTNSANDLAGAPFRGRGLLGIIASDGSRMLRHTAILPVSGSGSAGRLPANGRSEPRRFLERTARLSPGSLTLTFIYPTLFTTCFL